MARSYSSRTGAAGASRTARAATFSRPARCAAPARRPRGARARRAWSRRRSSKPIGVRVGRPAAHHTQLSGAQFLRLARRQLEPRQRSRRRWRSRTSPCPAPASSPSASSAVHRGELFVALPALELGALLFACGCARAPAPTATRAVLLPRGGLLLEHLAPLLLAFDARFVRQALRASLSDSRLAFLSWSRRLMSPTVAADRAAPSRHQLGVRRVEAHGDADAGRRPSTRPGPGGHFTSPWPATTTVTGIVALSREEHPLRRDVLAGAGERCCRRSWMVHVAVEFEARRPAPIA